MLLGKTTRLRALDRTDLPNAVAWLNDPAIRKSVASYKPMSMAEEERWYARMIESRTDQVFAIDTQKNAHIGLCGIHDIEWKNRACEVGIVVGEKSAHGKGYGTDAMRTLVTYAHRELGLHRVELEVFTDNAAAIKSYEKIGFVRDGVRRGAMWKDGAFHDLVVMSILPGEVR